MLIEYIKWIEIPIRVSVEYQKEEKQTWHYPGCSAGFCLEGIDILTHETSPDVLKLQDLKDYIESTYQDEIEEEAWEHLDPGQR